MDMLQKLKTTVTGALPGNPVTREFEIVRHVASAGPGMMWKIYDGVKKSTKEEASVFVFEKKLMDRYSKRDKDYIIDVLKTGVGKLTRLRHPKILSVLHPLEESRDSLAFATERVFASVANMLGFHDNMPTPPNPNITECKFFDVEIKYGLLQVTECLAFLHNDAKIVHGNICPESIVIAKNGAWKLAGFDFSRNNIGSDHQPQFECSDWNPELPFSAQPMLDYMAPEISASGSCLASSDMFSLGVFIHSVFNKGKPIYNSQNEVSQHRRNIQKLSQIRFSESLPVDLKEHLGLLVNREPTIRPDADQTAKIPFFEDVGVVTLQYLDSLIQRDNLQKSQFFKGLPKVVVNLPKRLCIQRILPSLCTEFMNHSMIPFVLPSVLLIAEQLTDEEYCQHALPGLVPVFKIQHPIQIILIFLQNMNLLLSKTPAGDIKAHILPLIYNALESDTPQIQEMCLAVVPTFADLVEYSTLKSSIFPRIKKLCLTTSLLTVRVSCLVCIGKLLEQMDKWFVLDEVLPSLNEIPSREPAVLMSILGIYQVAFSHPKLGITKELLATKVLPFLIPLCVDSNLNLKQFNGFVGVVKEMLHRMESEHRNKLEQINNMQQEQRTIDFGPDPTRSNQLTPIEGQKDSMMDKFLTGFGISSMMSKASTNQNAGSEEAKPVPNGAAEVPPVQPLARPEKMNLSMEEKRRLAREQEQHLRYKSQTALNPTASQTSKPAPKPRDLTASLAKTDFVPQNQYGFATDPGSRPANGFGTGVRSMHSGNASTMYGGNTRPVTSNNMAWHGGNSSAGLTSPHWMQQAPVHNQWMSGTSSMPTGFQTTNPVDLSAFDSLLAMPSQKSQPSLNQIRPAQTFAQRGAPLQWQTGPSQFQHSNSSQLPAKTGTDDIADIFG